MVTKTRFLMAFLPCLQEGTGSGIAPLKLGKEWKILGKSDNVPEKS